MGWHGPRHPRPLLSRDLRPPRVPSRTPDLLRISGIRQRGHPGWKAISPPERVLRHPGVRATSLDLFDPRSELRYDMNHRVPEHEHGRYATFIDIGSLEHVFDTRPCFENCLRMVAPGGHYVLHTPVNGYYAHGFHVFNPECLRSGLELNGFRVIYEKYSSVDGRPVADPSAPGDVLAWIVARKERVMDQFVCPQQGKWYTRYV